MREIRWHWDCSVCSPLAFELMCGLYILRELNCSLWTFRFWKMECHLLKKWTRAFQSPLVCSLLRHSSIADVKHSFEWCQMPTLFLSTIILTTNKRCCGPEAKRPENWQTIVRIILAIQSKANGIHEFCVGEVLHCEVNHNTRNVSANGFVLDRIASCLRFVPRGKMKNDKDTVMFATAHRPTVSVCVWCFVSEKYATVELAICWLMYTVRTIKNSRRQMWDTKHAATNNQK